MVGLIDDPVIEHQFIDVPTCSHSFLSLNAADFYHSYEVTESNYRGQNNIQNQTIHIT